MRRSALVPRASGARVGASADSMRAVREELTAAWIAETGAPPTLPELQIAHAQCDFEGGCGRAPYTNKLTGETRVINNWGAIQAHPNEAPCGPDAFEATDTHADGTPYQGCYRVFAPGEGGRAFVHQITTRRPTANAAAKRGDIDAYAEALRAKDPATGVLGYFEAPADHYAAAIDKRVQGHAAVLGEDVAARRGGPVEETHAEGSEPGSSVVGGAVLGAILAALALLARVVLL